MKKSLFAIALMLCAFATALAITPDDLKGKWVSDPVKIEDMDMTAKTTYKFIDDTNAEYKSEMTLNLPIDNGVSAYIFMSAKAKGTFTIDDNTITVKFTEGTLKFDFTEDDIRISGLESDPNTALTMRKMLYQQFELVKTEMEKSAAEEPDVLKDVTIKGKTMECIYDDNKVTFKKK